MQQLTQNPYAPSSTDQGENNSPPAFGKSEVSSDGVDKQGAGKSSFAIRPPVITLPKGGGAIKGIDEKFQTNAANGTASLSVPLPFSKTRTDLVPAALLEYNSGSGNSEWGLGWQLQFSSIQRRTDKKLPLYRDALETDTFMFTGAEDLVPVLQKDGSGNWVPDEFTAPTGEQVKRYRPRIESGFSRIEQIRPVGSRVFFWKVTSRNNIATIYGRSATARIADPADPDHIFKWMPELSYDDKGNCFEMQYLQEDLKNVPGRLHDEYRLSGDAPFTNTYLKTVLYGNKTPFYPDPTLSYDPAAPTDPQYFFEMVADYGDHDDATPTPDPQQDWPCRIDPFSNYKPGFEIRSYRLCRRLLFFHNFAELNDGSNPAPCLIRSLDLGYRFFFNPLATATEIRNAELDFIISIRQTGYLKNNTGSYDKKSLPPLEFTYQEANWDQTVQTVSPENIVNDPIGLGNNYQWLDLWNEGISGILTEQADAWYYKSNLGGGNFSPAQPVVPKPNFSGLAGGGLGGGGRAGGAGMSGGTLQLQDLDADGRKFIVSLEGPVKGYFELSDTDQWQPFRSLPDFPNVDLNDPDTKFIDLNGDGKPDLVVSEENVFTWYANKGTCGYDEAERTPKPFDEKKGAALVFWDPLQTIFLADMSGDGLTDIVRIRNGEICYWPNLGYGKFGAKITMDDAPVFDLPDMFNPAYLQLADVNGTGATDILYFGQNQCKSWLNLSGNGWSEPVLLDPFPSTELPNQLSVIDLLGNGTSCIVWSSPLPYYSDSPMRYIDLMGGRKPFIMNGYKNNAGKEASWQYKSSSAYYLQDKLAGNPWVTKLPFPVQCLASVLVTDKVTNAHFSNGFAYHHGYYDHPEGEFRGFGMVEQTDTDSFDNYINSGGVVIDETLYQSPVLTKTWFHTGAFIGETRILDQFAHEYFQNPDLTEHRLPDPVLPEGMTAGELREALRACKNMVLRQEVYALDGTLLSSIPYSVAEHNCQVGMLQPRDGNKYAVFLPTESEAISYYYERNTRDPRITHSLNIAIDELGNILQSASVSYPRQSPPAGLPAAVSDEQQRLHMTYTVSQFSNDAIDDMNYRLRVLYDTASYELTGINPAADYFSLAEAANGFATAALIGFEATPNGSPQKRPIEERRELYLKNNVTDPLPLGQQDTLGLPYGSYLKTFTLPLLSGSFGARVSTADLESHLTDGAYIRSNDYKASGLFPNTDADDEWWQASGRIEYGPGAPGRFYMAAGYIDAFGQTTTVNYYSDYFLLVSGTIDAIGNTMTVETFDWRVLSPQRVRDSNDNYSEASFDMLGFMVGRAVEGKGGEADDLLNFDPDPADAVIAAFFADPVTNGPGLLQHASSRYIYDLSVIPIRVATIVRETHYQQTLLNGTPSKLQLSFDYSDGSGHPAMRKIQAEPGLAKELDAGNNVIEVDTTPNLRWVGNGRTVLNNKGKPVKQYEPYFSTTYNYEDDQQLVEIGVTPLLYYDPTGRLIRTDFPDGSFSKVEFDAWQQIDYDQNDTVNDSDWYVLRTTGSLSGDPQQNQAAQKASVHYNTPSLTHLDSLGRSFYTIAHNRFSDHVTSLVVDEFYSSQIVLDIAGNQRQLIDARGNTVMEYRYGMTGNRIYQGAMDTGQRWVLNDCMGNPLYAWDSREQEFQTLYDAIRRPLKKMAAKGVQAPIAYEKIVYGEGQPGDKSLNLRGQASQYFDQGGMVVQSPFDFKGNMLQSIRTFADDYQDDLDWNTNPSLRLETFTSQTVYDALSRPVKMLAPYNNPVSANTLLPSYNESTMLQTMDVLLRGSSVKTSFVKDIGYDEKKRRTYIQYGNGVVSSYTYDPLTFRLNRMLTTRNAGADILQDLNYTYDPVGNITYIRDDAQDSIFFSNKKVEPSCDYTYDAIYRLTEALGREQIGQQLTPDPYDNFRMNSAQPGDGNQMQTYRQQLSYDAVGNMLLMNNVGAWNRQFTYAAGNNQMLTAQASNPVGSPFTYTYDPHGNMLAMPHLAAMDWNFQDELKHIAISPLPVNDQSQQSFYVYNRGGQRTRKVVLKGNVTEERLYLGGLELFRRTRNGVLELERETLHVMDDKQRIALVDSPTLQPAGNNETQLIRYQFSNHLDTACLELDDAALIISYEEYYPFGSTSYQAVDQGREVPAKRYRYTGKERDEESGLYYFGSRYYAPWLARWTAGDPIGAGDGMNLYSYVNNNPVGLMDKKGQQGTPGDDKPPAAKEKAKPKPNPKPNPKPKADTPAPGPIQAVPERQVPYTPLVRSTPPPPLTDQQRGERYNQAVNDLYLVFKKQEALRAEIAADAEAQAQAEKEKKEADAHPLGLDISVQGNPSDVSKDSSGNNKNKPSIEAQAVLLHRDSAGYTLDMDDIHAKYSYLPNEIKFFKELSLVLDVKFHEKDADGHVFEPTALGVQFAAVSLGWSRKKEDFLEFSLPVQPIIVDTAGNLKWQAAAEFDWHLNKSWTLFATGNIGGTYYNADSKSGGGAPDSYGGGIGVKFSIDFHKKDE